jgi:hypothetical protein
MTLGRMMTRRVCLSFGLALAVACLLAAKRAGPTPDPDGIGIVYVYFPSLCAAPGDASDCHEIQQVSRPSFTSMEACLAHADDELSQAHNPRVMASCMKQREG